MEFAGIELSERLRGSQILVVDDAEFNRMILQEVLHSAGFTHVYMAENGKSALAMCERTRPDLVILDLMMPEMDGFEFCVEFRKHRAHATIPIIAQTAMSSADERLRIFQHGANDLVLKPINPLELLSRIKLHLSAEYALHDLAQFQSRVSEELALASEMQLSLLPGIQAQKTLAESHGLVVSSFSQPSSELGGDLWGISPISPSQVAFYMFDISGHGVNAAINAFRIHTLIDLTQLLHHGPASYLHMLNARLCGLFSPGQFATFILSVIDMKAHSINFASAASTSPLLLPQGKPPVWLDASGFPLGILGDACFTEQSVAFAPGDSVLLYSDALIESPATTTSEFLTQEWLQGMVTGHLQKPEITSAQQHQQILSDALEQLGIPSGSTLRDDLTVALFTRQ